MRPLRVLSMDGGGVLSLLTLYLLQRIENARPGFLASVDVFAGTSAGGMNALVMASREDPASAIPTCIRMWDGTDPVYVTPCWRKVASFKGLVAFTGNRVLHEVLLRELGAARLRDLRHRVVVPAFDLRGGSHAGTERQWAPRVFHNFGDGAERDGAERAADVGLRTGAFPMSFPVHQGYADGGLFANNPSMVALAELLKDGRLTTRLRSGDVPAAALRETALLSIGTGSQPRTVQVEDADWGYGQWLLDPKQPLLFADAMLGAIAEVVDFECRQILGVAGYFRLNPPLQEPVQITSRNGHDDSAIDRLRRMAKRVALSTPLEPVLEWIDRSRWQGAPAGAEPLGAHEPGSDDPGVPPPSRAHRPPAETTSAPGDWLVHR
jgi:patatin-like phospholipase/acyl hydrolase